MFNSLGGVTSQPLGSPLVGFSTF